MTTLPDAGLSRRLVELRDGGRCILVPYLTSGFPSPDATARLMAGLADAGADVIELGVPFSDPLADGPVIQRASQRALEAGGSLEQALDALREFRRRRDTPVVVFSYLNPVLAHGVDAFIADALGAGADGVLLTDLPLGSDPGLESKLEDSDLALVRLIAPTTPPGRAAAVAARSQGFVYYISRTGVTGGETRLRDALSAEVAVLRDAASVPVAVGFGIATPEQAAAVGRVADGVVVGSALVRRLDEAGEDAAVAFVASLRQALDAGA